VRLTKRPVNIDAGTVPSMRGRTRSPEFVALTPATTWRNKGMNSVAPKVAAPTMKIPNTRTRITSLENSRSGSSGSGARASHATNPTAAAIPKAMRPMVDAEPQPYCWPLHATANSSGVTDVVSSAAPSQSTWRSLRRWSTRRRASTTTMATTPTGRLSQKHQCHDKWSTKNPPTRGPATAANA
jgi:hypothetical protein